MAELRVPAEIWCRTCGYFRPVAQQNLGKKEEFRERVNLNVPEEVKHREGSGYELQREAARK